MTPWRALVTGGSGFIGTNLVERLAGQAEALVSLDVAPPRATGHAPLWRQADLRDAAAVGRIVEELDPTHVFHLGARTDLGGRTASDYSTNTDGTRNLVAALRSRGSLQRLVIGSTRLINPIDVQEADDATMRPETAYGASKAAMEREVREGNGDLPWVITRPTSIWGPWFGEPYRRFFELVLRNRYAHPRGVRVAKTFGYVDNTVEDLVGLAAAPADAVVERTYYLGDEPPLEVYAWASAIAVAGGARRVAQVPLSMFRAAASVGDGLHRLGVPFPMSSYRLRNLTTSTVFRVDAAPDAGVPRADMDEGVRRTVSWLRTLS